MQNSLKSLVKFLEIFLPLVAILVTWYFNHEKKTALDIKTISEVKLTQSFDMEDISVSYMYHDTIPVHELWRTSYVIRNVGETTIYGNGFADRTINDSCIFLHVNNCNKLLSLMIEAENNGAFLKGQCLYIDQWHPNEYVTITLITEGTRAPDIMISDRDIKNAFITRSVFSAENPGENQKIIDKVPSVLGKILKWLYVIVAGFIFIAIFFSIFNTIKKATSKTDKFSSWLGLILLLLLIILPILWMF